MAQPMANLAFLDHSGEQSRISVPLPVVSAGNIVAVLAGLDILAADTLFFTIRALSLCNPVKSEVVLAPTTYAYSIPTSAYAQRELGLLVTYQDDVTMEKFRITIPGPDWSVLGNSNSDYVNTSAVTWIAFVTAFESLARSPNGNAVTVLSGRLVGRNR